MIFKMRMKRMRELLMLIEKVLLLVRRISDKIIPPLMNTIKRKGFGQAVT